MSPYLILVNVICQLSLAEFVEGNDDKSHEDVDEEERKYNKVDDVINGHLCPEPGQGALIFIRRGHGVL